MGEKRVFARRVFVEDSRRNGLFLRVTWHPEARQFVVSNWDGEVCLAATRVAVEDASELIGLLANGLADAATLASAPPAEVSERDPNGRILGSMAATAAWTKAQLRRFRGPIADVVPLRPSDRAGRSGASTSIP
jgi:hypothetical protein